MEAEYNHATIEQDWYQWWKDKKYFHADIEKAKQAKDSEKFIMMIPPPNITDKLHVGHALFIAIEDALSRW